MPTPDLTEIAFPPLQKNSNISFELSKARAVTLEPTINLPSQNIAPRATEISFAFDTGNILPEGMRRTQTCQNAYATALEPSALNKLASFHSTFSVFAAASTYYAAKPVTIASKTSTKQPLPRLHCDSLPLEPQYYYQMLKHPHANRSKQTMRVEIDALQKKNT